MSERAVLAVVFGLFTAIALASAVWAKQAAQVSAWWYRSMIRLYGFDGDVHVTPKAVKLCRLWNAVMAAFFSVVWLVIVAGR